MLQVGSSAVSSSKLLRLKMAQFRWQREHHHHHHLHFQNSNVDFNPPSETSPPYSLQSAVCHPDFRPFGKDKLLRYYLALHRSTRSLLQENTRLLQGGNKSCSKDAGCNLSFPICTFSLLLFPLTPQSRAPRFMLHPTLCIFPSMQSPWLQHSPTCWGQFQALISFKLSDNEGFFSMACVGSFWNWYSTIYENCS